jgi:hypothetical protein
MRKSLKPEYSSFFLLGAGSRWVCPLHPRSGGPGHMTVGSIADELIAGQIRTNTVRKILGTHLVRVRWADCVRASIRKTFKYEGRGQFRSAKCIREARQREVMGAFVKRNVGNCNPRRTRSLAKTITLHRVAIQRWST